MRSILGVPVHALRMDDVLRECLSAVQSKRRLSIGVVNAAKIVKMREDRALFNAVADCDLVLADGMAVVWAGRVLGQPLPERIAGIDLFERLLALADRLRAGVYLLGARQDVLDEVVARMTSDFPNLRVAGTHHGYFSDQESALIAERICKSGADMLFVAMSPPKKEFFLADHQEVLGVSVRHGVGGAFDVFAGRTRRAPRWMQRVGLEWFYRLMQEPGRMWRRYLVTNTAFAWLLLCGLARRVFLRQTQSSRADGLAYCRRPDDLGDRPRS